LPVDVLERHAEPAYDVGVEALGVQHARDVVDARRVLGVDHGLGVDVAEERDLALDRLRYAAVGTQHDGVWLDTDAAQGRDRVLRRLGLQLAGRADERHQRDVQEEAVVTAELVAHLTRGLEEGQRLDVADGPADLRDDDVDVVAGLVAHASLDRVGDVRDHLDGVAEVLAAALLGDHARVDLARGDVRRRRELDVEEALVVADVEVGLGAVLGDEHLAVLERVHGARVHVEVRVELLHGDAQTAGAEQATERRGGQTLAERGDHTARHEDVARQVLGTGQAVGAVHRSIEVICHGTPC